MHNLDMSNMFHSLLFNKSAAEIVSKATEKAEAIKKKIAEREQRINSIRKEHDIDESALVSLFAQARKDDHTLMYNAGSNCFPNAPAGQLPDNGARYIPAGVVRNLLTEYDLIEEERKQVNTLVLIARNLKPIPRYSNNGIELPPADFPLARIELEFLGF